MVNEHGADDENIPNTSKEGEHDVGDEEGDAVRRSNHFFDVVVVIVAEDLADDGDVIWG